MRILHCLASPFFTGPAEAVLQLALAQRAQGHQVSVAIDRVRRATTSEELAGPRLEAAGLLDDQGLELSVKSGPAGLWRDLRRLRSVQAEVVHSHFSHDHALLRLAAPRGVRVVRSIHAPRSLRWSTPRAQAWTVPTEALARRLVGSLVMVLPALVDPAFAPPADRPALQAALGLAGRPVYGLVSTFQPSRRHQLALEAFGRVHAARPESRLVLVGDGPLEARLRAHVGGAPWAPAVTFAGYRSGPDFVRWLQALDEVWILGLGNDFSGRAAAQARACGARVLAVDEGALGSWADELVAPTPEALAAAALDGRRRALGVEPAAAVARRVVELYQRARPAPS